MNKFDKLADVRQHFGKLVGERNAAHAEAREAKERAEKITQEMRDAKNAMVNVLAADLPKMRRYPYLIKAKGSGVRWKSTRGMKLTDMDALAAAVPVAQYENIMNLMRQRRTEGNKAATAIRNCHDLDAQLWEAVPAHSRHLIMRLDYEELLKLEEANKNGS